MQLDARELAEFYEAPMGQVARRMICAGCGCCGRRSTDSRVLGYGFATPYLKPFQTEAERVIAVMPAQQGVVAWPAESARWRRLAKKMPCRFPMRCSTGSWSCMGSKAPMRCGR